MNELMETHLGPCVMARRENLVVVAIVDDKKPQGDFITCVESVTGMQVGERMQRDQKHRPALSPTGAVREEGSAMAGYGSPH